MFGRHELWLLIAWVGLVSALCWVAQASVPVASESTTIVRATAGPSGQVPALEAKNSVDHSPLVPRVSHLPAGNATVVLAGSGGGKYPVCIPTGSYPSRSLQRQSVRWQI